VINVGDADGYFLGVSVGTLVGPAVLAVGDVVGLQEAPILVGAIEGPCVG
jgi:hypothetical protein